MNSAETGFQRNYYKSLHWFAIVTAVVAVGLIVAGALVTSTKSGDAVPDWPLSYGTLAPPMIGGILYEHSHRLVAGLTGILITVLTIWLWRKYPSQKLRWLGVAAFVAVVFQAVLGGLRVLVVSTASVQNAAVAVTGISSIETNRLIIAIIHGCLAQSILALLFAIVLFTSRSWLQEGVTAFPREIPQQLRWLSITMLGVVFVQLILGAVVRHTNAGLSIPDFPLAFGRLIPPFGNLPVNPRMPHPFSHHEYVVKVALHFAHRLVGFGILGFIIYLFLKYRSLPRLGKYIKNVSGLIVLQIFLGGLNIWTGISVFSTVLHVVTGSLILAGSVILVLWTGRSLKESVVQKEPVRQG